jgi:hypothetical protein
MPSVLLPFEPRRPGAVPETIAYIFRIVVHGLDRALPADSEIACVGLR